MRDAHVSMIGAVGSTVANTHSVVHVLGAGVVGAGVVGAGVVGIGVVGAVVHGTEPEVTPNVEVHTHVG